MTTEPQEPQGLSHLLPSTFAAYAESGETIDDPAANFRAAHRCIKDRYGSTAAPVAQEPPAPRGTGAWDPVGRREVLAHPNPALGLFTDYPRDTVAPPEAFAAPGSAQEPADPPHEWTKAEVDALLAVPELREAIGKALRALVPVIDSLKALGL